MKLKPLCMMKRNGYVLTAFILVSFLTIQSSVATENSKLQLDRKQLVFCMTLVLQAELSQPCALDWDVRSTLVLPTCFSIF